MVWWMQGKMHPSFQSWKTMARLLEEKSSKRQQLNQHHQHHQIDWSNFTFPLELLNHQWDHLIKGLWGAYNQSG